MDGTRRTTTVRQLELLADFAEAHRDLALGRLRSKEARALAVRLWRECADILNSEGPARSHREWAKVWNDSKCRVKSKLTSATVARRTTGGGPCTNLSLTAFEERVAGIIGHDVGPMPNVGQDQFLEASTEENEDVVIETIDMMDDALPGPSHVSLQPPPQQSPLLLTTPAPSPLPSSVTTTPRRRLQRPRQRTSGHTRPSRVRTAAPTSRDVLDESRAMVLRIEELRARTDSMLAQAALVQAEAAKTQADASMLQTQTVATFCETLSSLMPVVRLFLASNFQSNTQTAEMSLESVPEVQNPTN